MSPKAFMRTVIASLVVLAVVVLVWVGFHHTEKKDGIKEWGPNSIHTPYEMTRQDEAHGETFPFSSANLLSIIDKANAPIDFYGKVVDQDGNGLEGVKISCTTGRIAILDSGKAEGGSYKFSFVSGEGGYFHISGFSATSLSFYAFEKEGYLQPTENRRTYTASTRRNTKEDPALFYLWKTGGGTQVRRSGGSVNDGSVNAGFREITLSYGQNKERREFGTMRVAVNADLEELASIPRFYYGKTPYDWSATIEIPDGGISLTQEPLPYLAPEKGYVKKAYVEMRKDNPHWTNRLELKAYVHNEALGLYSRWEMAIYIRHTKDANGVPQWDMNYTLCVNPDGTRILEPASQ